MTLRPFAPSAAVAPALIQTTLASLRLRNRKALNHPVAASAQAHILDCGDGVRLQCWISAPPTPCRGTVVLLHGWEGCHDSVYLLSAACALHDAGWRIARLNLRDHGFTHALNREMFHSARLDEVLAAIRRIGAHVDDAALRVVGFSLGGNFTLRVALQAKEHALPVQECVAVCPAISPYDTVVALDACPGAIRRYFLGKWQRTLLAKEAAWPGQYDFTVYRGLTRFEEIMSAFAEHHTEFGNLEHYCAAYDLSGALPAPQARCTVITAKDDPVVRWQNFGHIEAHPDIPLIATERGGHCGFIEDLRLRSWLNDTLVSLLSGAELPPPGQRSI